MIALLSLSLVACANKGKAVQDRGLAAAAPPRSAYTGHVYLYGEAHGVEKIMDREFELWKGYYAKGLRDLFVEMPYYTAEFLNLWLKEKGDDILEAVYDDWEGTALHNPYTLAFLREIKRDCPETVFHGTDVGHQYDSTGERFLKYLEDRHLESSAQYALAKEAIGQGMDYYDGQKDIYRENAMAANFARELGTLHGVDVMGIYGSAHTGLDSLDYSGKVPCMARQLKALYGDIFTSEDLSEWARHIDPLRTDTLRIAGRDYQAYYYGREDLKGFKDYRCRDFWRVEAAYEEFKGRPRTGDVLPYDNYPMIVEDGQMLVIDYTRTDGSISRLYYLAAGKIWQGKPATEGIDLE